MRRSWSLVTASITLTDPELVRPRCPLQYHRRLEGVKGLQHELHSKSAHYDHCQLSQFRVMQEMMPHRHPGKEGLMAPASHVIMSLRKVDIGPKPPGPITWGIRCSRVHACAVCEGCEGTPWYLEVVKQVDLEAKCPCVPRALACTDRTSCLSLDHMYSRLTVRVACQIASVLATSAEPTESMPHHRARLIRINLVHCAVAVSILVKSSDAIPL